MATIPTVALAQNADSTGALPGGLDHPSYGEADSATVIEVHTLAPGVFAAKVDFVWTGWVVARDGIVLIDATPSMASAAVLADTIRARSGEKPFRYVVATHAHEDHCGGLRYFASRGAAVVAHESAVSAIDSMFAGGERFQWVPVGTEHRIPAGERPIEIYWLGRPAHTSGDLIVYLPKQRTLFAGDLVSNRAVPWMLDPGMSLAGWSASVDSLVKGPFKYDTLIPGHGVLGPPIRSIQYTSRYLRDVNDKAARIASWGTKLRAIRDWGYLGSVEGDEFYNEVHFLNMRRLYNEARGHKTPGRNRPSARKL